MRRPPSPAQGRVPARYGRAAGRVRRPSTTTWRLCLAALCGLAALWLLVVPSDRARLLEGVHGLPKLARTTGPPPGAERASVSRVIDGDTLVLADGRTVRLLGIDTPETVHPDMAGPQPFGEEAARRLRSLVEGREVRLERDVSDTDHFGRSLRHLWLDRELVTHTLLREGLGYAQAVPPDRRHAGSLREAEAAARAAGRGLWGADRPTPLPIFALPEP